VLASTLVSDGERRRARGVFASALPLGWAGNSGPAGKSRPSGSAAAPAAHLASPVRASTGRLPALKASAPEVKTPCAVLSPRPRVARGRLSRRCQVAALGCDQSTSHARAHAQALETTTMQEPFETASVAEGVWRTDRRAIDKPWRPTRRKRSEDVRAPPVAPISSAREGRRKNSCVGRVLRDRRPAQTDMRAG
jgi:hypothetical protein